MKGLWKMDPKKDFVYVITQELLHSRALLKYKKGLTHVVAGTAAMENSAEMPKNWK